MNKKNYTFKLFKIFLFMKYMPIFLKALILQKLVKKIKYYFILF